MSLSESDLATIEARIASRVPFALADHARDDVPALAEEVRRLRKALQRIVDLGRKGQKEDESLEESALALVMTAHFALSGEWPGNDRLKGERLPRAAS